MNILLMEPSYDCKYPPLGLMKIAYYHKERRNDTVWFVKGKLDEKIPADIVKKVRKSDYYIRKYGDNLERHLSDINFLLKECNWDRVYVSTLFTFEYEKTIRAIEYAKKLVGRDKVYAGGILATLLTNKLMTDTGVNIITGQIHDSEILGFDDHINIDILTPDYSILDNIEYEYENSNAYYAYTTRGCGMNCGFCAVKTLEPNYSAFIPIRNQIEEVKQKYGEKRDLLLMDNNVLKSPRLEDIIREIEELGFKKGATYKNLVTGKDNIRYVDFNQGLDAFLITERTAELLGRIALKPARIAFDHIEDERRYAEAIRLAVAHGSRELSNYLLYNSEDFKGKGKEYKADSPCDLYNRLKLNVKLQDELNEGIRNDEEKVHIFSFPMRYIPLDNIRRGFVGPKWNKKYLRAIQRILIPTQGKGVSSKLFFYKAFGKDETEFMEILLMPELYIASRGEPEKIRNISEEELIEKRKQYEKWETLREEWRYLINHLSEEDRVEIETIIGRNEFSHDTYINLESKDFRKVLLHYFTYSGILALLEYLYMNEYTELISEVKNYINDECSTIYDNLVSYLSGFNSKNSKFDVFARIFGKQGISDIVACWAKSGCNNKALIGVIKNYGFINEAQLYIVSWVIKLKIFKSTELENNILDIIDYRIKKDFQFYDMILNMIFDRIKEIYTGDEYARMIEEVKNETVMQLSIEL